MTILDDILAYKREEIARAKRDAPASSLEALAGEMAGPRGFERALRRAGASGFALIAEIKKASPSRGVIRADFEPAALARSFERGGAACLSVLTDGPSFQGSPKHLRAARDASALPVLRKDFMIDPYQVAEARAWGADCILLIMTALDDGRARELAAAAHDIGLDVLIETHNENELERALALDTGMIGVNNRDLRTFETSLATTERLAPLTPADRLLVSESGIGTHGDLVRLAGAGARAFLVGERLMTSANVEIATRDLLNGARRA